MSPEDGRREREARSLALERAYVHDVYDQISCHFSSTRYRCWPRVTQFLDELDRGALVADVGCGNGKYLQVRKEIYNIGVDRCWNLANIASKRGNELTLSDNLCLPFRESSFDACLSIAVIHHFGTTERRVAALRELARVLRVGGKLMITVWAMEQKHRKFESQDVLIPWHHPESDDNSIDRDPNSTTTDDDEVLHYRTCDQTEESTVYSRTGSRRSSKKRLKSRGCIGSGSEESAENKWEGTHPTASGRRQSEATSPKESCYGFVRRALQVATPDSPPDDQQKLTSGRRASTGKAWPTVSSEDWSFLRDCSGRRKGFRPPFIQGGSLDSQDNIDDIPIELRHLEPDDPSLIHIPPSAPHILARAVALAKDPKSRSLSDLVRAHSPLIFRGRLPVDVSNISTTDISGSDDVSQSKSSSSFLSLSSRTNASSPISASGQSGVLSTESSKGMDSRSTDSGVDEETAQMCKRRPTLKKQKASIHDIELEPSITIEISKAERTECLTKAESDTGVFSDKDYLKLPKVGVIVKQSSLNDEIIYLDRFMENEKIKQSVRKQSSLNEDLIYGNKSYQNESFKERVVRSQVRHLQVIKEGFQKLRTASLDRFDFEGPESWKNGILKLLQSWKSEILVNKSENASAPYTAENDINNTQTSGQASSFSKLLSESKIKAQALYARRRASDFSNSSSDTKFGVPESKFVAEESYERKPSRDEGSDSSKESSLQSDTSLDSEDSCVSVIFVPKSGQTGSSNFDKVRNRSVSSESSEGSDKPTSPKSPKSPKSPGGGKYSSPKSPGGGNYSSPKSPGGGNYSSPKSPGGGNYSSPKSPGGGNYSSPKSPGGGNYSSPKSPGGGNYSSPKSPGGGNYSSPGKFLGTTLKRSNSASTPGTTSEPQRTSQPELPSEANQPSIKSSDVSSPSQPIKSTKIPDEKPTISESQTKLQLESVKPKTYKPARKSFDRSIYIPDAIPPYSCRTNLHPANSTTGSYKIPHGAKKDYYKEVNRTEAQNVTRDRNVSPQLSSFISGENLEISRKATKVSSRNVKIARKNAPRFLTFEVFNPETDDLDSDSSASSSPHSGSSVIERGWPTEKEIEELEREIKRKEEEERLKASSGTSSPVELMTEQEDIPKQSLVEPVHRMDTISEEAHSGDNSLEPSPREKEFPKEDLINLKIQTLPFRCSAQGKFVYYHPIESVPLSPPHNTSSASLFQCSSIALSGKSVCDPLSTSSSLGEFPYQKAFAVSDYGRHHFSGSKDLIPLISPPKQPQKAEMERQRGSYLDVSRQVERGVVSAPSTSFRGQTPSSQSMRRELSPSGKEGTIGHVPVANTKESYIFTSPCDIYEDKSLWVESLSKRRSYPRRVGRMEWPSLVQSNFSDGSYSSELSSEQSLSLETVGSGLSSYSTSIPSNQNGRKYNDLNVKSKSFSFGHRRYKVHRSESSLPLLAYDVPWDPSASLCNSSVSARKRELYLPCSDLRTNSDSITSTASISTLEGSKTKECKHCKREEERRKQEKVARREETSDKERKSSKARREWFRRPQGSLDSAQDREKESSSKGWHELSRSGSLDLDLATKTNDRLGGDGSLSTSQDSLLSDTAGGAPTLHRYYHVFKEGELDHLIEKYVHDLHIISSYYDHANWCVIAEKVRVWTI